MMLGHMVYFNPLPLILLGLAVLGSVSAQTCSQYGNSSSSGCLCPPGFNSPISGNDCTLPVCGGSLYAPGNAAPGGEGDHGNLTLGQDGCACSTGWQGPACTVCTTQQSCQSSLSQYLNTPTPPGLNSTLVCSTTPTTYSSSQMTCNVVTQLVQTLFPGSTTLTITRTLDSALTPGGAGALTSAGLIAGTGEVRAQLWYDGTEQFYCQAGGCTQTVAQEGSSGVNASTWECPTLACTCRPGTDFCGRNRINTSQNLTGAINVLQGPLTITCSGSDVGSCSFNSPFLQAIFGSQGLGLTGCSFGECVQQYVIDEALGITTATSDGENLSGGVIAGLAVVGVILLAIIALLIWGLIKQRKARRNVVTDGAIPRSGGVGVKWSAVGYEIKTAHRSWDKTVAWVKGSGERRDASGEQGVIVGPGGGKVVLRDSCGQIPAGGLVAILGPSGAGKSTLVDILAGKRKAGRVEGVVGFTNKEGGGKVNIGYVDQSDVLSPTSTVLETLLFAAKLRLPESVSLELKAQRAQTVLEQLGLEHVAHTRVGSTEHRGISGGEMRRVSIGIELVAAPDVLVLDEPTSGLDSVSAARLIKLLKGLTTGLNKTTIIASIHQPSSALYHSFDQVALLAQGRQLYFGPGGSRPAEYFASQGRPCPNGYNIADHLLEIASSPLDGFSSGPAAVITHREGNSSSNANSPSNSSELNEDTSLERRYTAEKVESPLVEKSQPATYPPQALYKNNQDSVDLSALGDGGHKSNEESRWIPRNQCATTFLTQLEVLSGREWRNLKRDKTLLIAHVFFACIVGVFAGGLYYKVGITIAGFQNRVGSLFFLGSLIAFSSLSALYNLVEVRGLFLRERAGNFYSPQAWLLSRIVFDVIPLRLIPTILVSIIVYFMVGLAKEADRFFKYLLILVEFSLGMTLFNFLLACIFSHGGIAILLSSLCNLFLMTYAGFFVNLAQIPPVLRWLRWFSTLGYTLEALAVNEVGAGLLIKDSLAGVPVEINAQIIMETLFGFGVGNYYRDVLVLFAFIAGYSVLLVGAVIYLLREKR